MTRKRSQFRDEVLRYLAAPRTLQQCQDAFEQDPRVRITVQNMVKAGEVVNLNAGQFDSGSRRVKGLFVAAKYAGKSNARCFGDADPMKLDFTTGAHLQATWMGAGRVAA